MPVADSVRNVVQQMLRGQPAPQAEQFTERLVEALGWMSGSARTEELSSSFGFGYITRGLVADQPAVVFANDLGTSSKAMLNRAALFAYHSSIEWGIVTDPVQGIIFNSHWVRQADWFQLPPIVWGDFERWMDVLEAITPEGLASGRIEQVATRYYRPEKLLAPVDNALVERLDFWRAEALRYTRELVGVDEKLHKLFAQLFVLRAVEDRGLAPALPTLESSLGGYGVVDVDRLRNLFENAKDQIQSELFDEVVFPSVHPAVLAGIINDLYVPSQLPLAGARYNFAWISADVLGRAYEKYLSTILVPAAAGTQQLTLWEQPVRDVERVSVQKASGVYYTPSFLVRYLTERSLDEFFATAAEPTSMPRVADFSCGSGSFLAAAVDSLIRRLRAADTSRNWGRELVAGKRIVGIDNDERAVTLARLSIWLRLAEEPNPLPLPRLHETVVHSDALARETFQELPQTYDVVLGNPPFIATGKFPSRDELAARFQTAKGRFDYSYLFIELALQKLCPGGVLGMIVPNRLFRNQDASGLRDILTSQAQILTVTDFGSTEVFSGISAYIGTVIAQKLPSVPRPMRTVQISELPSRVIALMLSAVDKQTQNVETQHLSAYNSLQPKGWQPWLFLSPRARGARVRLEENSIELAELAGVFQGIKTGANDIFLLEVESQTNGPLIQARNSLGDVFLVESALLRPAIFGADIRRYDVVQPSRYLLYTYRYNAPIAEGELRESFPLAFSYLSRYQELLANRGSIAAAGLRWYELVRKRDEAWLQSRKLLIRDLAMETSFAVDDAGATYLVGGTAVVPSDASLLLPLLACLNSKLLNWYLSQLTPSFRSGFQKFEPQHLLKAPIPHRVVTDQDVQDRLTEQVLCIMTARLSADSAMQKRCEEKIERMLSEIIGVDEKELREVP